MLSLIILKNTLAIVRLETSSSIPAWAVLPSPFFSITKTKEELSIVCLEENVPIDVQSEKGWRAIQIEGPLDFSLTGILSSLLTPLAEAKVSILAISTFDTDYLLVKQESLQKAVELLKTFCHVKIDDN